MLMCDTYKNRADVQVVGKAFEGKRDCPGKTQRIRKAWTEGWETPMLKSVLEKKKRLTN